MDSVARKVYRGHCDGTCAIQRANFDGSEIELVVDTEPVAFNSIEVIPSLGDACGVTLTYTSGTLELDFQVATSAPATWNVWLSVQDFTVPFWSIPLPVIDPPLPVNIPIPGFPQIGTVGFLTTLTRAGGEGIVCSDWKTIDTGPSAVSPTAEELKQLFRRHAP